MRWTSENGLKRGLYYKLTDEALSKLREAELAKLEHLKNKNHVFEQDFHDALAAALGNEAATKHRDAILKAAAKGGQGGRGEGDHNQVVMQLLADAADEDKKPAEVRNAFVEWLVKGQTKTALGLPRRSFSHSSVPSRKPWKS